MSDQRPPLVKRLGFWGYSAHVDNVGGIAETTGAGESLASEACEQQFGNAGLNLHDVIRPGTVGKVLGPVLDRGRQETRNTGQAESAFMVWLGSLA